MVYFKKSQPSPTITGAYNTSEVIGRLEEDFHNKCYICEKKEPTDINIEHFVPHKGNNKLKFDWNNLFFSCVHCNNIKLGKFNSLLNCTVLKDKVDTALHYYCKSMPKEKPIFKILIPSDKATSTQALLDKCFNGEHTPQKKLEGSNLRSALLKEIKVFQDLLFDYEEYKDNDYLIKIKYHLNNQSGFTAFKRWIVKDSNYFSDKLVQYILN